VERILGELERERSRIARDLHAGAGQPLAAIKLNLELLAEHSAEMPESARKAVARLRDLSDSALEQIRAVSHRLHPPDWQELSTGEALRNLLDRSGIADWARMTVRIESLPVEPAHFAKVALYRCAQECLANIIRHSHASRVEFALYTVGDRVGMRIYDNGKGIEVGTSGPGIGLQAIREHIEMLGGEHHIGNALPGTTITVSFPLAED